MSISTQVLFFDNLGALEAHLQALLGSYKDSSEKCKEALGNLLREKQGQKEEKQWSQEISKAFSGSSAETGEKKIKKEKGGMFGSDKPKKEKSKMFGGSKPKAPEDWIAFEPFAVFVGQESKGMAELYFEAINNMDETAKKVELALNTLGTLKGKVSAAGNVSAVVSFVNGIPVKVMLKPAQEGRSKKKMIEVSFRVPAARPAMPRVIPL